MRVLVTGGQGFIGLALTRELRERGHYVASFDLRKGNDAQADDIFYGSVLNQDLLGFALKNIRYDVVVHTACVLGVARTEADPIGTMDVIVQGTRNICVAATPPQVESEIHGGGHKDAWQHPRLVYLSSSEIYGNPPHGVHLHEHIQPRPLTPYAAAKLCAEHYVRRYAGKWSIVRPFNIYGPEQDDAFVVKAMVQAALAGDPIRVFGDGKQVRSFCYVADFARGLAEVVEGRADGKIVNLGRSDPVTMNELAKAVKDITDSDSRIEMVLHEFADRPKSREIDCRIPDIAWAKEHFGFSPDTPLGEGIRLTMEAMRK